MNKLLFEVFVKGAIDVFYDDRKRKALVDKAEALAEPVPFLPCFLVRNLCDSVLERASQSVTPILVDTYYQFLLDCASPTASSKLESFTDLLRHNLLRGFIEHDVLRLLSLIPRHHADKYALLFVGAFLEAIDAHKLDDIMTLVAKDPRIRHALIVDKKKY